MMGGRYETNVHMDRSIAPINSTKVGTFGGWLLQQNTGHKLGLAAGHVCLSLEDGIYPSLPVI